VPAIPRGVVPAALVAVAVPVLTRLVESADRSDGLGTDASAVAAAVVVVVGGVVVIVVFDTNVPSFARDKLAATTEAGSGSFFSCSYGREGEVEAVEVDEEASVVVLECEH